MTAPATIQHDAYYDVDVIARELGLRANAVERARKSGELRSTKRGGRVLYRGSWIDSWLSGAEQPSRELATAQ